MSDLNIHRDHQLGLARARAVAAEWAEQARAKLDLQCELRPGETEDRLLFSRSGVSGEMVVTGEHFALTKLGFLLKPFAARIEAEAREQLDQVLAREGAPPAA